MKIGKLKSLPFKERFWAQVDRRNPDECWLWKGYIGSRGYGYVKRDYRTLLAHRVSYQMAFGSADGLSVCHRCDTPACVNPNHLFLGTAQDNSDDMCAKGRSPRPQGEKHGCSKLKAADVVAIRQSDERGKDLAKRYGVTPSTISNIRHGKSWSHIQSNFRAMGKVAA
jgi:hypothetical protein